LTKLNLSATLTAMITIRLQRRGRKNDPSFRVIVTDSKHAAKSGNYLEMVGSYDARSDRVDLKPERIKHWMSNGAKVSDTVHNILVSQKIIEGKKINVLPRKTVAKLEEPAPVAAPQPTATLESEVAEPAAAPETVEQDETAA
jgi:small subunit ribosomal protein S16